METVFLKTFYTELGVEEAKRAIKEKGFKLVETPKEAQVIVLYSAAVNNKDFLEHIAGYEQKTLVIAGPIATMLPDIEHSKVSPEHLELLGDIIEETIAGNILSVIAEEGVHKLPLKGEQIGLIAARIPLLQAYHPECEYSKKQRAKGLLPDYTLDEIKGEVEKQLKEGRKEFWIDPKQRKVNELITICKEISALNKDIRIKIEEVNPSEVTRGFSKYIELFLLPQVYKYLLIPFESGDNYFLEDQGKTYTSEDIQHITNRMKKEVKQISISVRVFVGQKEDSFKQTIETIKLLKPDEIKETVLENTKEEIIQSQQRDIKNTTNWVSFERNRYWFAWKGEALIVEKSHGFYVARNIYFKQIILTEEVEIGKVYPVRITKTGGHELVGKLYSPK